MEALLKRASELRQKVYFLGAKDSTLELLHGVVTKRFPRVNIVGMHNGYFPDSENAKIADMISAVSPDIVFIGMPSPKKETFVMACKDTIDAGVLYCVGGAFDAMAGVLPRPPKWLMFGPMEGVLRILRSPSVYWKRALMCFRFKRFARKWKNI
jgi:N-acetylglucosaminyldiphosphoundecaprenol N-acetyl-beta-D-mannosaminyltransferase